VIEPVRRAHSFDQVTGLSNSTTSPQSSPSVSPDEARHRRELLQESRELVISRLSKVIGEALTKMGDELSTLALDADDPKEQGLLLDAVDIVRQHRGEIELRFRRSFTNVFERRLFNRKAEDVSASAAGGMLELLDDAELQAKLEVDRLVQRSRGRLDPDEVLGIRARLAALVDREWFDEERHPASPDAVFEALKDSIAPLASEAGVRSTLLNAFEPHVSVELNQVYQSVNDRLRAGKVLPEIRPRIEGVGASRRKLADPVSETARQDSVPGVRRRDSGDQIGGATAGQGLPAGAALAVAQLDARIEELLAEMSQGSVSARATATQILTNPDVFDAPQAPLASAPPKLLEALSRFAPPSGALIAPEHLFEQIDSGARESASPLDQLTVEMVSMVFDYIYTDKRLADPIKQQLLRLQVVAIKAALIDRSFFARRRHPMRMLIDRICEVAAEPDLELDAHSPVATGIEQIVDSLLSGFDNDLATFDQAREQVDELLDQEQHRRTAKLARITKAAERAEAVLQAWSVARSRFVDRLEPDTPSFVKAFLDQWWSMVLAECEVSGPQSKIAPQEVLELGEILIWSVAPKPPDEVSRLAGIVPRLIKGLTQGLTVVKVQESDRKTFFDALLQEHTRAIAAAKQGQVPARNASHLKLGSDGRIRFNPATDAAPAVVSHEPLAQAISIDLAELGRGDYIEVDIKGEGEFLAFRLAWVSPAQQVFVLSRHPQGAMSLDRVKLVALFDHGRARIARRAMSTDSAIAAISTTDSQGPGA